MPLTLTVPAPDPTADPTVEMRPRHLREWLGTLPLTDLAEVSRTLGDEIAALNRQKAAMETRLKLLELYRAVVLKLLPALEESYVAARLPLPEKNRQMADLAHRLQMELANGYKIILLDYQNRRITLGKGKTARLAAYRALSALGRILAIHYQTYAPPPSGIWFEIHQIFRFAVERGLASETLADEGGESSIALAYKQTLLLALSNPYRLNPGDAQRILDYLALFGNLAQLQPFAQSGDFAGLFLVQTGADAPPRNILQNLGEMDSRHDILLNTLELAHALRHHAGRLEAGEPPGSLRLPDAAGEPGYRDLLRRLLTYWSAAPKRVYPRTRNISGVQVCIGLAAIRHFLDGETAEIEDAGPAPVQPRFAPSRWLIVNESAGGLALRGMFETLPRLRPGEVIGLKADGGGEWNIAVVRWAQSGQPNKLEIGGQLLAPRAAPARIKPAIAGTAATFQDALLLPEIPLLKQPETLLAPRGTFGPQRELALELGDNAVQFVRAARLVEQTTCFDRFEFSRAG